MDAIRIKLHSAQQAHAAITSAYQTLKPWLMAEHKFDLTVKPETRTTAQNRRMWAMLDDVAEQVLWHGRKLESIEWKDMATAALKGQKVVPGIGGGFVVLGTPTSKMTISEMSDVIDFLDAFGAEHGVRFTAPEYESEAA